MATGDIIVHPTQYTLPAGSTPADLGAPQAATTLAERWGTWKFTRGATRTVDIPVIVKGWNGSSDIVMRIWWFVNDSNTGHSHDLSGAFRRLNAGHNILASKTYSFQTLDDEAAIATANGLIISELTFTSSQVDSVANGDLANFRLQSAAGGTDLSNPAHVLHVHGEEG